MSDSGAVLDRLAARLPAAEDERTEFKAGKQPVAELPEKLARAASAFWNSGGGVFAVGVGGDGRPDEGFPLMVGRQDVRDWIDQHLRRVEPPGAYTIEIAPTDGDPTRGLVVVTFAQSDAAPHMAPDGRYYIRAGAHTARAGHFIVEALWARRVFRRPVLRHLLRTAPDRPFVVELLVLALTDAPALDVEISIEGVVRTLKQSPSLTSNFPIKVGVIDREHPFAMDYEALPYTDPEPEETELPNLKLSYLDVAGTRYASEHRLSVLRSIGMLRIGDDALQTAARSLEGIGKSLSAFGRRGSPLQVVVRTPADVRREFEEAVARSEARKTEHAAQQFQPLPQPAALPGAEPEQPASAGE